MPARPSRIMTTTKQATIASDTPIARDSYRSTNQPPPVKWRLRRCQTPVTHYICAVEIYTGIAFDLQVDVSVGLTHLTPPRRDRACGLTDLQRQRRE